MRARYLALILVLFFALLISASFFVPEQLEGPLILAALFSPIYLACIGLIIALAKNKTLPKKDRVELLFLVIYFISGFSLWIVFMFVDSLNWGGLIFCFVIPLINHFMRYMLPPKATTRDKILFTNLVIITGLMFFFTINTNSIGILVSIIFSIIVALIDFFYKKK